MAEKTKAIAIKKDSYHLGNPNEMSKLALVLKDYVKKNNLSVSIQGKDYTMVEGWQFAGGLMGLFPKVEKIEKMEGAEISYLAEVHIINAKSGALMSTGFAMCSKSEAKKKTFDEYAVLSMAQTRAIGKAYRNLIGWVMKMAGFESTPAEEVAPEEVKGMFLQATKKINACKDINTLLAYKTKIESSKKYNTDQKKELVALINERKYALESNA